MFRERGVDQVGIDQLMKQRGAYLWRLLQPLRIQGGARRRSVSACLHRHAGRTGPLPERPCVHAVRCPPGDTDRAAVSVRRTPRCARRRMATLASTSAGAVRSRLVGAMVLARAVREAEPALSAEFPDVGQSSITDITTGTRQHPESTASLIPLEECEYRRARVPWACVALDLGGGPADVDHAEVPDGFQSARGGATNRLCAPLVVGATRPVGTQAVTGTPLVGVTAVDRELPRRPWVRGQRGGDQRDRACLLVADRTGRGALLLVRMLTQPASDEARALCG